MMKEAVIEFNDREIIAHSKTRFESQRLMLLRKNVMRKAGELGFLSVSRSRGLWRPGYGICIDPIGTCDYISSGTGSFSTAFGAHTGIGTTAYYAYMEQKNKSKSMFRNLASGEWFGAYCLTEPESRK